MRLIWVEDEPDLGVAVKEALVHQAYIWLKFRQNRDRVTICLPCDPIFCSR